MPDETPVVQGQSLLLRRGKEHIANEAMVRVQPKIDKELSTPEGQASYLRNNGIANRWCHIKCDGHEQWYGHALYTNVLVSVNIRNAEQKVLVGANYSNSKKDMCPWCTEAAGIELDHPAEYFSKFWNKRIPAQASALKADGKTLTWTELFGQEQEDDKMPIVSTSSESEDEVDFKSIKTQLTLLADKLDQVHSQVRQLSEKHDKNTRKLRRRNVISMSDCEEMEKQRNGQST